jgi:predicted lipid-binding transport protein (Tim44 family)
MVDIIFFAAIAFFIFYKLNKEFGKVGENEKKDIIEKLKKRKEACETQAQMFKQKELPVVGAKESENNDAEFFKSLDEASKQNFIKILQSSNITAEFFVNGAKSAFEMIIKAFTSADLDTLKFLLSEKIFQGFEASINQRKSAEKNLVTNLISIEKADVISVMISGNLAMVILKIVSKQINYITDKDNQIIEGRKDEIAEVTDVWTFKRDLTSQSPNWTVSATNS